MLLKTLTLSSIVLLQSATALYIPSLNDISILFDSIPAVQQPAAVAPNKYDLAIEAEDRTIWRILKDDANQFSRLTEIVEKWAPDYIKTLDSKHSSITFFSLPNEAFPPKHHHDDDSETDSMIAFFKKHHHDDHEHEHKERPSKKQMIKYLVAKTLEYHTLQGRIDQDTLTQNATVATSLKLKGALNGNQQRIRVEQFVLPKPVVKLNVYATITEADINAANGLIHSIDHALFPPLSIWRTLYMHPVHASTFTSALQNLGAEKYLDLSWDGKTGTSAMTALVPTNEAFAALPKKLLLFLFSPFGKGHLRALLKYHALPHDVLWTNLPLHVKDSYRSGEEEQVNILDDGFSFNVQAKTALHYAPPLNVTLSKERLVPVGPWTYSLKIGDQKAELAEGVARNGAIILLDKVLQPPLPKGHPKVPEHDAEAYWDAFMASSL